MPHVIEDMDAALNSMVGNASEDSSLLELKDTYHDVDDLIGNSSVEVSEEAHEYCDKVSGFLLGNFEYEPSGHGTGYDIDALINEGGAILDE